MSRTGDGYDYAMMERCNGTLKTECVDRESYPTRAHARVSIFEYWEAFYNRQRLHIPVCVDKAVLESPYSWATEIRHERNIGDFTGWKNHDEYQNACSRLLRDLKAESK